MITDRELSSFGALLKHFRTHRHLTQQQLAKAIGVHRNAIGRWEQGDFLPASKAMVLELARHLRLDDQETRRLLEASLTASSPHWCVPLPRNPFFTGREEILEVLYTQLCANQAIALTQSSALHGLGGVGKTQIALEYAYRQSLEYSAVFWIGAETEEQIVSSLLGIADVLQLPERDDKDQQRVIAAVQRWLTTHSQWLLIWDNVEDLTLFDRFLPSARQGAILITTRCQVLGTLAWGINLLPMGQEEGMLFLLRRAKVLAPEATSEQVRQLADKKPFQYAVASELVTVLGGLPLALDQAGAYLEATQCGLSAYLDLFCTQHAILLQQRGEGSRDHPASVSTTFTLAIKATTGRHPAMWDLLRTCALLLPDNIPEELFRQGGMHLGATLETVYRDALEWDRVVAVACAYSLLSRQPEAQTLSLHRLVQVVLLDTMTETEREQQNQRAIEALNTAFPEVQPVTEYATWKQRERLLPHALLCLSRTMSFERNLAFASLAFKAAQYLRERGRYVEAEPLLQQSLSIRERVLGSDHPEVATSLHHLAFLFFEQGKYAEAEPLYQRALRIRERVLGSNHPNVATSLNNLAMVYREQNKYAQAEPLYLHALYIWKQNLGPNHPNLAYQLNNLANLYREQGKYAQAEMHLQQAWHIWKQIYSPDHPNAPYLLTNLADLYAVQGKYAQAEPLYQQAWRIWEQTLGPDHPNLAHALTGLANLCREQGKYTEAEPLYLRTLTIREQHLGQHHPETAQTLHDLAVFRQKQDNLSEAVALAERALSIRSQALGDAHPKTATTRTLRDQLLQEQTSAQEEMTSQLSVEVIPDPLREELQPEKASLPSSKAGDPSFSENDPLQGFLAACCDLHPRAWCRSADLWQSYEHWIGKHQDRFPLSRGMFIAQLKAHGCRAGRTKTARIWRGIALVKKNDNRG